MLGQILPLVVRSLRVDARDIRPHVVRGALAIIVLITLITNHINSRNVSAPGLTLFWWVCQYNYWGITFAAATFFATAITEEKEERTLALLKMADVGPGAMILGKWFPRLLMAAMLIAVQYPFTILCVTLGGLTWQQVSSAYLSLFAHLFLVGNIGLLMSVVCAFTNSAVGLTVLILFFYHLIPWSLPGAMKSLTTWLSTFAPLSIETANRLQTCADWAALSVGRTQLVDVVSSGWIPGRGFQIQVYGNLAAGLVLMLASLLLFEPCTRNEVAPTESIWQRSFRFGLSGLKGRTWPLAIIWKDLHYVGGGPLSVVMRYIVYITVSLLTYIVITDFRFTSTSLEEIGDTIMVMSIVLFWIDAAVLISRFLRMEIVEKTWSTLCMLPKHIAEISYSKLAGISIAVLPAVASFLTGVVLSPEHFGEALEDILMDDESTILFYFGVTQPLLILHLTALISITLDWATWAGSIFIGGLIVFMINFMLIACLETTRIGPGDAGVLFFFLSLIVLGVCVALQFAIGTRLYHLQSR